jgi:hypothetical protein
MSSSPRTAGSRSAGQAAESCTSPVVDDFFTAAQATAEITAECGNYEMWEP